MRDTESHSSVWTTFYMAACDSMCLTLLSTRSLHNFPVERVLFSSSVNEETEAQTCDVPQPERSTPVTQVADQLLTPLVKLEDALASDLTQVWMIFEWGIAEWRAADVLLTDAKVTGRKL